MFLVEKFFKTIVEMRSLSGKVMAQNARLCPVHCICAILSIVKMAAHNPVGALATLSKVNFDHGTSIVVRS